MESFGIIVACSVPFFETDKEVIWSACKESGLKQAFFPEERKPGRAFAGALKEAIQGEPDFLVRNVIRTKAGMMSGLVKEEKLETQKDLNYTVTNVISFDSGTETIQGKSEFRTESVKEAYKLKRTQLSAVELNKSLKQIFWAAMSIDVMCKKAYFVPHKFIGEIDKVVRLFKILKEKGLVLGVEIVAVDKGSQTRNTIVSNFTQQTLEALDVELRFTYERREKFDAGNVKFFKARAFQKQLEKVSVMEERIKVYIVEMELTPEEDKPITDKLELVNQEIRRNIALAASLSKRTKPKLVALP